MRKIDLSILMAVYNGENWLKECVDSVLFNTGVNYEFIIVNDGSIDDTEKILNSYNNSILKIFNISNLGLTKALNFGLTKAKGKFVARIDADDLCYPTRFEKQIDYLTQNSDLALVGSNAELIDENGSHQSYIRYPKGFESINDNLLNLISPFPHSSIMFRKKIILNIGGYNENFYRSQDYDLYLRLSEKYYLECIQEPLIKLRLNEKGPTLSDKNQIIYGIAALICFYKRKLNLIDPSMNSGTHWEDFLEEIKLWARGKKIYDIISYKRNLRLLRTLYSQKKYSKMFKVLITKLLKNPSYIFKKKLLGNLPKDIALFLK